MKIIELLEVAIAPAILMIYGFYLGQLNVSMQDLAGIIMFVTGLISLIIGLIIYFLTKPSKWYWNVLISIGSCIITFTLVVIYSKVHG